MVIKIVQYLVLIICEVRVVERALGCWQITVSFTIIWGVMTN